MASSRFASVARWLGKFWRLLDSTRRVVVNLLLLAVVAALVVVAVKRIPSALDEKTALVLDLKGAIVEQHAGGLRQIALTRASGQSAHDTQLRPWGQS